MTGAALPTVDAVVVGAGHAGLLAGHALATAGATTRVVERARVAQSWRDRHPELRLITTRAQSRLGDLAWPPEVARWPDRDDVVRQIERFAAERAPAVETGTAVTRAERRGDRWHLSLSTGVGLRCRMLVVATGRHARPYIPAELHAALATVGPALHSSAFSPGVDPRRLRAGGAGTTGPEGDTGASDAGSGADPPATALVVGGGASALDVSRLLAASGTTVLQLTRSVPIVLRETVAGVAVPPVAAALAALLSPAALDVAARLPDVLRPRAWRALRRTGPARASDAVARGALPGVDRGYVDAVVDGRITLLSQLEVVGRRCRATVRATGARTSFVPDVSILATGFTPDVGFLPPGCTPAPRPATDGRRAHDGAGVAFVGFRPAPDGQFAAAARDARRLVDTLRTGSRR